VDASGGADACARAREDIAAAVEVLSGHPNTGHVAGYLCQQSAAADVVAVASDGWRLASAARKFCSSEIEHEVRCRRARTAFKYLMGIARDLAGPWEPRPVAPAAPRPRRAPRGGGPPSKREDYAAWREKLMADLEGI
jgi:hypothetical protein